MSNEHIFILHSNTQISSLLEQILLASNGFQVTQIRDRQTLDLLLQSQLPDIIIIGDRVPEGDGLDFASSLLDQYPDLPILLASDPYSDALLLQALRLGIDDYIFPPFESDEVMQAIKRSFERHEKQANRMNYAGEENANIIHQHMEGLEALQRIGQKVTAFLDLDSVLTAVVDAAVELTGAEEGSLLLVDEDSGELYMRAARNFREEFVRKFRLTIQDTLPGEVLRSGQPLLINTATPKKIKTSYLVHTLMYVPMSVSGRVIGVLGVDNRRSGHPFDSYHLDLMRTLADYAAISIENARLYADSQVDRYKFETLLNGVQDGIIVLDPDGRMLLMNPSARSALKLEADNLDHKSFHDAIQHPDLLELLSLDENDHPYRGEITLDDGQVLSAQVTPIPDVGLAVIMQDITYLKELDRIKSDFVNSVSHDLRSPLTAIQGYIELLRRVGPLNQQQQEFTQRIQISVQSITSLINDLLELGRIEAGFDARKEIIPLSAIMRYTVEGMQSQATSKAQTLELDITEELPHVLGNPVRLRQMLSNLITNALTYTPHQGTINIRVHAEDDQVIIQVVDNGIGIPVADQPYIYDKFYRGSNLPAETPGTGLGLAIVKSIVESHRGRIWVESTVGEGSTFTVVLPIIDQEL